jgi:hypothetical protein
MFVVLLNTCRSVPEGPLSHTESTSSQSRRPTANILGVYQNTEYSERIFHGSPQYFQANFRSPSSFYFGVSSPPLVSIHDHSDQDMNLLRPLERLDRGFESHSGHGCLCAFILCLCCPVCAGSGLASGWSPVQEVLPSVYRLRNWKSGQGPIKGCRATEVDR